MATDKHTHGNKVTRIHIAKEEEDGFCGLIEVWSIAGKYLREVANAPHPKRKADPRILPTLQLAPPSDTLIRPCWTLSDRE